MVGEENRYLTLPIRSNSWVSELQGLPHGFSAGMSEKCKYCCHFHPFTGHLYEAAEQKKQSWIWFCFTVICRTWWPCLRFRQVRKTMGGKETVTWGRSYKTQEFFWVTSLIGHSGSIFRLGCEFSIVSGKFWYHCGSIEMILPWWFRTAVLNLQPMG